MKEERRVVSALGKFFTVNFKCNCVHKKIDLFILRNANETPGITESNRAVFLILSHSIVCII